MKRKLILLLTLGSLVVAEEPLTLQMATARALAGNPKLQASRLEVVAAQQRVRQSVARRLGNVDLVGQYNHFDHDRVLVPMSKELLPITVMPFDRNQNHFGVTWQIPLLAGGSLREGDAMARLARDNASRLARFTREETRYNVRAAYRNVLVLRHAVASAQAMERALEEDNTQAQRRLKVGRWAQVDAAKVEYALQDARSRTAGLQAQADDAEALLAAFMGQDPPARPFTLQDLETVPEAVPGIAEDLKNQALKDRQDLQAVQGGTAIADRRKALAKWSFSPQLALSGSYLKNEAPSVQGSMDTHEFTVSLKIPLFDGGRRRHALSEANANLAAAHQLERGKLLDVQAQVGNALGRYRQAQAQFQAGLVQRRLGQEVARVEHLKLEQGLGRVEDYLTARAQQMNGETAYWQGLYGLQSAADYLDFVTGKEVDHD
jgi:outer membrane protein TolC